MPTLKQSENARRQLEKARERGTANFGRNLTNTERMLVTQAVAANPAMTKPQVRGLAKSMGRNPATIQKAIEKARGAFMGSAGEFVKLHKQGVRKAIKAGPEARGFAEGLRSLQWAIERMHDGSARIVERDSEGTASGTKIYVGVKVGGEISVE